MLPLQGEHEKLQYECNTVMKEILIHKQMQFALEQPKQLLDLTHSQ